jgi:hypothetical protein
MVDELLKPKEVDILLRYPAGRATRLAKRGLLPYILLPDGSIRFRQGDIEALVARPAQEGGPPHG